MIIIRITISLIICCFALNLQSQISEKGLPPSLLYDIGKSDIETIEIQKPDLKPILTEDSIADKNGEAYRMGILLKVDKNISNSGNWTYLKNGDKIWRLKIKAKDALATSLYFNDFHLPKGSKLFLYNDDKTQIIGAFTHNNNHSSRLFATELTEGDNVTLEYYEPNFVKDTVIIQISEINYAYRGVSFLKKLKFGFGSSGSCEVNVNCTEGADWQLYKSGVVRINVKIGGSSKWCTGSLVNNTLQDLKPYLLTADHCEANASASDITQWMFYFNYEAPACNNPASEGNLNSQSMTGAVKIADGGDQGNSGSDFLLLLLNQEVPKSYNPYFLGWDRTTDSSLYGVSIHHPAGDIKKISTYNVPLSTSYWTNTNINSHWRVSWIATANGHGVTEGGSSGAPIFNKDGLIVGTLTGGDTYCSNLLASDYYGKFNWHWDKNGLNANEHLKEWLDPAASNIMKISGKSVERADFTSDKTKARTGEDVNFFDKSIGNQYQYEWNFENGNPATSTEQNPKGIKYFKTGNFDVSLKITSPDTSYYLTKNDYITIWDEVNIYVNQNNRKLIVDLRNNTFDKFDVYIYNLLGKETDKYQFTNSQNKILTFDISNYKNGIYLVRISSETAIYDRKITIMF